MPILSLLFQPPIPLKSLLRTPKLHRTSSLPHRTLVCSVTPPSPRLLRFLKSAQEGDPYLSLQRADAAFTRLKSRNSKIIPPPQIVHTSPQPCDQSPEFDVIVAGGTLGILYAAALQTQGWRVAVIERGQLKGRVQEWNISRKELSSLLNTGVCSEEQLEDAIVTECHVPGRVGFASKHGSERQLRVSDVLNVGVAPDVLIRHAAANFLEKGGVILDLHSLRDVRVCPDAVQVHLETQNAQAVGGALGAGGTGIEGSAAGGNRTVTARVLVDAMGSFSPIAEQARFGRKPDGVCITVGSCMKGPWKENDSPDLIYSFQPINPQRSTQYFWEAFPVAREPDCRTTYMFAYGSCDEQRQTLTDTLEDYVRSVTEYQQIELDDMTVKRIMFGFFPSYYRDSPTDVGWDRILPVGDAGGLQSPISFGGFGCCMRHLDRITSALNEALRVSDDSLLTKPQLQGLQWYLPSLSVTGLFNKAMQVQSGQTTAGPFLDEYGINDILWSNMRAMESLGEDIQRPFLQDIVTAGGLTKTLGVMAVRNPQLALKMTAFLGPLEILSWSRHFFSLLGFAAILPVLKPIQKLSARKELLGSREQFWLNRLVDATEFGTGADASKDRE